MIELGKIQKLKIIRETSIGVYLNTREEDDDDILLPQKQVPMEAEIGDEIEVFIYRDSQDRLIATTNTPLITLGELAVLKVLDVTKIGAFINWGLERDLFLPFNEQSLKIKKGEKYLFGLYIDKSNRIAATMYIEKLLSTDSPYKENDQITGTIYSIKEDFGALVAVDNKYHGLIHTSEFYGNYQVGSKVSARVVKTRTDGKLDLSLREEGLKQVELDGDLILRILKRNNGFLPFNDKSSPEEINKQFSMSKGGFKRAIGNLYKARLIIITDKGIQLVEN